MNIRLDKIFFYDWMGGNEWLFKQINGLDGDPTYNSLMVFLTNVADHKNFPYYFIAFATYGAASFFFRKLTNRAGAGHSLVVWIGILSVFGTSYAIDGLLIKDLKEHFSYPRPYVALDEDEIHVLGEKKEGDGNHSFPSGHAAFITVLVCSIWPALTGKKAMAASFLIFAVCWSRIAMGMHFPVDVVSGFMLSFIIVLMVRFFLYNFYAKVFKWKC